MRSHMLQLGLLFALAASVACSKKQAEPTRAEHATISTIAAHAPAPASTMGREEDKGKLDPNDPKHGTRKLMGLDAPVYVDGAQVAVMRFGELPPIPVRELEGTGRRYKIYDYLAGIGIAPESIKSVHFHGNADRIASIEGSELRKEKDRFEFSFISGNTGTPLQKWDTDHLKNPFVIHEIRRVSVFVKKPVPAIHPKRQCHVALDGDCTDAIPYATGEVAKGTRVYLDGKMVGFVKRRTMTDDVIVDGSSGGEDTRFSLAKYVAHLGVDPASVKSFELIAGDDVVARSSGEQLRAHDSQTYFTLPKHNHGKVRVHVPAEFQAHDTNVTDRDALVSSVLLYRSTAPAPTGRDLVAISEDTDLSVQLAAVDDVRARGGLGRGEQ